MKFKIFLAAATLALAPVASNAASVSSSGVAGGCAASAYAGGVAQIDVLAGGSWDASFHSGDLAGGCAFDLVNSSATNVAATISVATVNQFGLSGEALAWGFEGGVDLVGGPANYSWAEGEASTQVFMFNIAANSSVIFDWFWGDAYVGGSAGNSLPNIDFTVGATPVPVPAGILLMGTALAGFGVMRRKSKKTA